LSRHLMAITIVALAAALYAVLFKGVQLVVPVNAPQEITWVHAIACAVFVIGWLAMSAGLHKKSAKAYISGLNAARPPQNTILDKRSSYHAG